MAIRSNRIVIAWAVLTDDNIDVKTVSETRRGAIINHLVSRFGIMIYNWTADADIEALWAKRVKPNQLCTTVMVQRAPPDVAERLKKCTEREDGHSK